MQIQHCFITLVCIGYDIMPKFINFNIFKILNCPRCIIYHKNISPYSTSTVINVFDGQCKALQRERAFQAEDVQLFDYLKDEIGSRVADRLFDVSRKFENVVDLGCGRGHFAKHVTSDCVGTLHLCDVGHTVLEQCALPADTDVNIVKKIVDPEKKLPFEDDSVDLFVSSLNLHWINNLPGIFCEVKRCLRNDGAFLGAMFGGDTLYELRCSLQMVETERLGGVSAHVSPFTQISDVGRLLNQAGFTLLTIDTDEIVVGYPSIFELMWDLKGMGENNAVWRRCSHLHRDVAAGAAVVYQAMYGSEPEHIPATFQLVYFIGWKPDPSQPKPAARGSQSHSFKDLQDVIISPKKG